MPVTLPPSSLVISTRSRPDLVRDTVLSVLAGEHLPSEIIVIDQSDQPNHELAELPVPEGVKIQYVLSQTRGVSRGRNEGVSLAHFDPIAIIDDDMYVATDWFECLMQGLVECGETCVVTGKVLPAPAEGKGDFAPSTIHEEEPSTYTGRVAKDVLFSGNMALFRSAFLKAGGFDERLGGGTPFPSAEDNDLGYRLLEAGYKIQYLPSAVVYHRAWRSSSDYYRVRWDYGIGRGGFYSKHLHLRDPFMARRMAVDLYRHTVQFPFNIRRRSQQAIGDLVLSGGMLVGSLRWLVKYPRRSNGRSG